MKRPRNLFFCVLFNVVRGLLFYSKLDRSDTIAKNFKCLIKWCLKTHKKISFRSYIAEISCQNCNVICHIEYIFSKTMIRESYLTLYTCYHIFEKLRDDKTFSIKSENNHKIMNSRAFSVTKLHL